MKKSFIVSKEKTINATPGEVWKVITDPILFNDWMYVPGQIADEKPFGLGSKIQWTNDENVVYLERCHRKTHHTPDSVMMIRDV